jgi:hypothetical protein
LKGANNSGSLPKFGGKKNPSWNMHKTCTVYSLFNIFPSKKLNKPESPSTKEGYQVWLKLAQSKVDLKYESLYRQGPVDEEISRQWASQSKRPRGHITHLSHTGQNLKIF